MKHWCFYYLLSAVALASDGGGSGYCPIRFKDTNACACSIDQAPSLDRAKPVTCYDVSNYEIRIQPCYCMYYDSTQNLSIVGHCAHSCYHFNGTAIKLNSSAEFNADICQEFGNFNRTGRFCGQCTDSYGLAAYSYKIVHCIPCQDYGYKNWLKYFAVAFLPLTMFYILAVLLSFNVTSSSLNGVVLIAQCILSPVQVGLVGDSNILTHYKTDISLMKTVTSVFCAVNLDFFRLVYPPFCLHPEASVFQILSLDYLVALYPFLLIFMTYVLVTAYDKRYRLVVWMWRPFQWCVHRHRNTWNIRTSLIEIFATFILFSSVKILDTSIQILTFTPTYDIDGNRLQHYYTSYNGTMEYFGPAHLPCALIAIVISSVFVVLPTFLLAVYPCRCFHKCLNCCRLRSQALHAFMDAFQGSYRIEPHDLRYFSAFYLLLRMLILLQPSIFQSTLSFLASGLLSFASAAIIAIFRPYKVSKHNTVDSVMLMFMGIYFVGYHAQFSLNYEDKTLCTIAEMAPMALFLVYFLFLLVWKLFGGKLQAAVRNAGVFWSSALHIHSIKGECLEEFDRDLDANDVNSYPPLLGGSRNDT